MVMVTNRLETYLKVKERWTRSRGLLSTASERKIASITRVKIATRVAGRGNTRREECRPFGRVTTFTNVRVFRSLL